MTGIDAAFTLIITAGAVFNIFAFFCVLRFFGARKNPLKDDRPPVSVLKPLKGLDEGLEDNLRSFCAQDYREYEVLLGFCGEGDEALTLARRLEAEFPGRVRVVISKTSGANTKVSNLEGLLEAASYEHLAINDSDMRVDRSYLKSIVGEFTSSPGAGMVTSLYKITVPASTGAAFESLTIALDLLPSVLAARALEGMSFGLGASMLVSKKALEEIGGLKAIADYLADDYQLGNRISKAGRRVVLSRYVLEDVTGGISVTDFLNHQIRWARTYKASRPKGFFGSVITHAFPFSLMFFIISPGAYTLGILALVSGLRLSLALLVHKTVMKERKWLKRLILLPVKDTLSLFIWLWSYANNKVIWRGRKYRILKDGKVEAC